ncbi:MAG: hypothetical protein M0C28_21260 [Candidatus Moduliflexus flocculans]|nr:hypothetical protein [Candidatus Moduliflexus flocculans]
MKIWRLHARMHGMRRRDFNPRIDELLELTGPCGRQHDFPGYLSGGTQRRRRWWRRSLMVHDPQVLFPWTSRWQT